MKNNEKMNEILKANIKTIIDSFWEMHKKMDGGPEVEKYLYKFSFYKAAIGLYCLWFSEDELVSLYKKLSQDRFEWTQELETELRQMYRWGCAMTMQRKMEKSPETSMVSVRKETKEEK